MYVWLKKVFYTHTHTHTHMLEYFSATGKKKILLCVTTCMHLKGIMLTETSQTEKDQITHGITNMWALKIYIYFRGAWVAQLVECQTFVFSSGHDVRVVGLSPKHSMEPA